MLTVDSCKILGVFGHDFQDVIGGACHQVTLQHIRYPAHRFFKGVQHLVRLPLKRDFDENRCRHAHLACIQQGNVISDVSLGLQPLHPPVTGRGAEVDLFRQVRIRHPALALKRFENTPIGRIY